MFILTVKGKDDGAYSVVNEHGVKVLYILKKRMMQLDFL